MKYDFSESSFYAFLDGDSKPLNGYVLMYRWGVAEGWPQSDIAALMVVSVLKEMVAK